MEIGIRGKQTVTVSEANTARAMGSGTMDVFATPAMIALMEKTAWMSVADVVDEGCVTVGIRVEVSHDAPTPVGGAVTCESELVKIDGRRLCFEVRAYDERGVVGKGTHERFIVNEEKFLQNARSRTADKK